MKKKIISITLWAIALCILAVVALLNITSHPVLVFLIIIPLISLCVYGTLHSVYPEKYVTNRTSSKTVDPEIKREKQDKRAMRGLMATLFIWGTIDVLSAFFKGITNGGKK